MEPHSPDALSTPEHVISQALEDGQTPGVMVEVDAQEAERLGAFEEAAIAAEDALEANWDLSEQTHG